MRCRYKPATADEKQIEFHSTQFNTHAFAEILTGDDSAFISEIDVYIEAQRRWIDMSVAFNARLIVPDNFNVNFGLPINDQALIDGYNP